MIRLRVQRVESEITLANHKRCSSESTGIIKLPVILSCKQKQPAPDRMAETMFLCFFQFMLK